MPGRAGFETPAISRRCPRGLSTAPGDPHRGQPHAEGDGEPAVRIPRAEHPQCKADGEADDYGNDEDEPASPRINGAEAFVTAAFGIAAVCFVVLAVLSTSTWAAFAIIGLVTRTHALWRGYTYTRIKRD